MEGNVLNGRIFCALASGGGLRMFSCDFKPVLRTATPGPTAPVSVTASQRSGKHC